MRQEPTVGPLYRIRRKSDGKFFGAGQWGDPFKGPGGKLYTRVGHAKGAMKNSRYAKDCEIVEYEVREIGVVE